VSAFVGESCRHRGSLKAPLLQSVKKSKAGH
jgi:hypothetical protein